MLYSNIFPKDGPIIPILLSKVRTKRKECAHKSRDGQYLLLRTNRKRTVRGAHKTRDSCTEKLNMEQRRFFDHVIESVLGSKPGVMVVDAPGGTGKTFVLMAIINYLRSLNKIVIVTAMSSLASILLPGGRTLHFKAAVPINVHD